MENQHPNRIRGPPAIRFAAPQHFYDLALAASTLRNEPGAGEAGRRQTTLYKHGGTTVTLFLFGRLTHLAPHRTNGTVTIHVLSGHLRITADGAESSLRTGTLLVLASEVEHSIVAPEESTMLLTVHLVPSATAPAAGPAPAAC